MLNKFTIMLLSSCLIILGALYYYQIGFETVEAFNANNLLGVPTSKY